MQVRAAISNGQGAFALESIEVAPPLGDEVLVEMRAAGVCHTDWDSLRNGRRMVIGHEGAGLVLAMGPDVRSLSVGDHVILNWAVPCGACFMCDRGKHHLCEINSPVIGAPHGPGHARPEATTHDGAPLERSFHLGTMSTHTVVREAAVVPMPADVPFPSASIVGCGVMTGYGSVVNAARVAPGDTVCVLGAGGVGLNVIQASRISQASRIIAIDTKSHRLDLARRFGATDTVHARSDDAGLTNAAREVHALTDGRGADFAFECTAVPELGAAPLAMVRNAGCAVQVSGVEQEIVVDMNLFEWDKRYINPLYGQCQPARDFPRILEHYAAGELALDELVTRTYALDDLEVAFDDMLSGKNAKGVLVIAE